MSSVRKEEEAIDQRMPATPDRYGMGWLTFGDGVE